MRARSGCGNQRGASVLSGDAPPSLPVPAGAADAVIRAPGKVFLTGEYAVLWGAPACVAAVSPGVIAYRSLRTDGVFELVVPGALLRGRWTGTQLEWDSETPATRFAARALALAVAAGGHTEGMRIAFQPSSRSQGRRKLGLGSSAAACTVAALAGLAQATALDPVFLTAARAHWEVQGRRGSNGDVAASTYGGIILYERYPLESLTPPAMPRVEPVGAPGLQLALVFSGQSARTPSMVAIIEKAISPTDREHFVATSREITLGVVTAMRSGAHAEVIRGLNAAGDLLSELGQQAGVSVVTPELSQIQTIGRAAGVASKVTGAGGGDGAIFASFDIESLARALAAVRQAGYFALELPVAPGANLASPNHA